MIYAVRFVSCLLSARAQQEYLSFSVVSGYALIPPSLFSYFKLINIF
jgi:hypothetical protein